MRRITPACAGKTLYRIKSVSKSEDHPRLRGENRSSSPSLFRQPGSPPLARGKHAKARYYKTQERITPACAGKTPRLRILVLRREDHPRLRGENEGTNAISLTSGGSPPLARGKHKRRSRHVRTGRITPACAGKTVYVVLYSVNIWDHPRLRGVNGLVTLGSQCL